MNQKKRKLQDINPIDNSNKKTKLNCCICLNNICNKGIINPCQHEFCYDCIYMWSKQTNTCPICRERFNKINNTKIDNKDYKMSIDEYITLEHIINFIHRKIEESDGLELVFYENSLEKFTYLDKIIKDHLNKIKKKYENEILIMKKQIQDKINEYNLKTKDITDKISDHTQRIFSDWKESAILIDNIINKE